MSQNRSVTTKRTLWNICRVVVVTARTHLSGSGESKAWEIDLARGGVVETVPH